MLPEVARHLGKQRLLPMHDFIVRQRQHEVLGEGVNHTEREFVLVMATVDGVAIDVTQGVVHPPHIPLHAEAQTAVMHRMRHAAPGC